MPKKFPYKITDETALRTSHPEFFKDEEMVVKKTIIDREGLYMQIKLDQRAGRETPGVIVGGGSLSNPSQTDIVDLAQSAAPQNSDAGELVDVPEHMVEKQII